MLAQCLENLRNSSIIGMVFQNLIPASGRNPLTFLIIRQILLNETKNVLLVKKDQMFTVHKQVAQSRFRRQPICQ